MKKQPLVIAIAAVSGGGKTTMTEFLKKNTPNTTALFYDDYDFEGPVNILDWIENGAEPNEWDITPLLDDLQELLTDSFDVIVLDYPFAYQHPQLSKYIDLAIFIDTPLDVAMARRMLRDYSNETIEEVHNDLHIYLEKGRMGYINMLESIKPNCDVIINGTLSQTDIFFQIKREIKKSFNIPIL
ncbi:hypothetical protein ACTWP4_17410 [Gracilibacillus sp. D59]|uniref:hypothetical protein n=1 Tax=Gracilibacillus sp. D59 TaxID=3457434 RepID=UPI003FCD4153